MSTVHPTSHNLRFYPLPPNLPRRRNRLRPHRFHPLNRSRSLRRRDLRSVILPASRRPGIRRGARSLCLDCVGWKLHSPCDQDGWKGCSCWTFFVGYIWCCCFWSCDEGEEGLDSFLCKCLRSFGLRRSYDWVGRAVWDTTLSLSFIWCWNSYDVVWCDVSYFCFQRDTLLCQMTRILIYLFDQELKVARAFPSIYGICTTFWNCIISYLKR